MRDYSILKDKVVLVTGGSRGIGFEIAKSFAQCGAKVIITGRSRVSLATAVNIIQNETGSVISYSETDVSNENDIVDLAQRIDSDYGKLDILVNNAGITLSSMLSDTTISDWDQIMNINARGTFLTCRECIGLLRNGNLKLIINISSVVGVKGYAMQTAYTASKHAVRGFSIALAEELKPEGFRVHVICPGGVATDMVSKVRPDINKNELIGAEEISEAVIFLAAGNTGNGVIDEIRIRRESSGPWF